MAFRKQQQDSSKIETERKKASHILHYLMERRQEVEYRDPFELLRNMNDVLYVYGDKPIVA
jgi:hypothetical protein